MATSWVSRVWAWQNEQIEIWYVGHVKSRSPAFGIATGSSRGGINFIMEIKDNLAWFMMKAWNQILDRLLTEMTSSPSPHAFPHGLRSLLCDNPYPLWFGMEYYYQLFSLWASLHCSSCCVGVCTLYYYIFQYVCSPSVERIVREKKKGFEDKNKTPNIKV